ncbi:hypothetical protein ABZ726_18250 [Streptomyces hundungensis]|uniref:hypothetical protein n=1 Tax=Streptomyces hundungensis TaxID=1077946 RepID=UPI003401F494
MNTTQHDVSAGYRSTVTRLRAALQDVESEPSPASLIRLDAAIADVSLVPLSDRAERIVRASLEMVSEAAWSDAFDCLKNLTSAMESMLQESFPPLPVYKHPTTQAAVTLVTRCYGERDTFPKDSAFYRAWDRAVEASFAALRSVTSYLYGETDRVSVRRCAETCVAAVGRAVAYRALYVVRKAHVQVAHCYGLFPIGGRQPLPDLYDGAWTRELGSAKYRFEVTPPDFLGGAPHGWVLVTRVSDGVRVHALALTERDWKGMGRSRNSVALYRI